ncbi:hypothetical protein DH2020_047305 [Rehmannia glutinosa]|uniref:GDSL esterase/lipase n=1 Tax=Rehmannia glutinosa TaxID=99300 RepID=A0ABR0U969_REHGL
MSIAFPPGIEHGWFNISFGVWDGYLCLANACNIQVDVWVLKQYGVAESWTRNFILRKSWIPSDLWPCPLFPIKTLRNGNILMSRRSGETLISFDPKTKTTSAAGSRIICPFQALYQLGDSTSDTGNLVRVLPVGPTLPAARPPYGNTFPGTPTGRWSDGRLIIDFTASALGLPLLNPYLNKNASFKNGVNFAVAGSTALNSSFFASRGIIVPSSVGSLNDQLNWFRTYLSSICSTPQGALQIVVPGNFPIGCFPYALSAFASNDSTMYDEIGCIKSLNNLATFQNNNLQVALDSLRREFPNVVMIYADYYNAFQTILRQTSIFGFDPRTLLKPCCASREFNPVSPQFCGSLGVPVCQNPNRYIHWDGLHLTEEAHRRISKIIVTNILLRIKCTA